MRRKAIKGVAGDDVYVEYIERITGERGSDMVHIRAYDGACNTGAIAALTMSGARRLRDALDALLREPKGRRR